MTSPPSEGKKALIGIRFSGGPLFSSPNSLGVRTWFLVASCGALASALWHVLGRLLCARPTPSGHSSGVGWPRALPCFPRSTGAISIVPCGMFCRRYRSPPLNASSPHAFRRGDVTGAEGVRLPLVRRGFLGCVWHSPAFGGYVDMSRDVELAPNSSSMSTWTLSRRSRIRYTSGLSSGNPLPGRRPACPRVSGFPEAARHELIR